MNSKQREWADLVISGMDRTEAYLKAFPGSARKTAQNQVSRFGKDAGIMGYIQERSKSFSQVVEATLNQELANQKVGEILTNLRKREILAKIASGKMKTEKIVWVDGKQKRVKCLPDFTDIMKAIDIDNKMSGDNVQPKPAQIKKAEEVTKVVVVEDQTAPPTE